VCDCDHSPSVLFRLATVDASIIAGEEASVEDALPAVSFARPTTEYWT